jgi:hypothetical protein
LLAGDKILVPFEIPGNFSSLIYFHLILRAIFI